MSERVSAREAARRRMPLDGSDAQALEGALAMTESERDVAIAERDRLRRELEALREQLAQGRESNARVALAICARDCHGRINAILRGEP